MTATDQPTQACIDLHDSRRITINLTSDRDRDEITRLCDVWQATDLAHTSDGHEQVDINCGNGTFTVRFRDIREITFH